MILEDIIKEMNIFLKIYREEDDIEIKKEYDQYIELIITEAPKSEQYKLCDHWSIIKSYHNNNK